MGSVPDVTWQLVETIAGRNCGEFLAACPLCGPDCRSPSNRLRKVLKVWRSEPDYATFNCARCEAKGWVRPDEATDHNSGKIGVSHRRRGAPHTTAYPLKADPPPDDRGRIIRIAHAEFVYFSARQLQGSLAERYLGSRGLAAGDELRFSEATPTAYEGASAAPAMIAAVRNLTGGIVGIQTTFLTPQATKTGRKFFGRVGGGAVRLAQMGQDGRLAVAEGVETALAFSALYGLPCWAALSAGGLETLELPAGLRLLTIAADNDENGRGLEAAQKLAKRASERCEVHITAPAKPGDWNDVLLQDRRAAA